MSIYNGIVITDAMINNELYNGTTYKEGCTIDNEFYIVKYMKSSPSDIYSEYVASRFIRNIGISAQETWLGFRDNTKVVILKDFAKQTRSVLHSFRSTRYQAKICFI